MLENYNLYYVYRIDFPSSSYHVVLTMVSKLQSSLFAQNNSQLPNTNSIIPQMWLHLNQDTHLGACWKGRRKASRNTHVAVVKNYLHYSRLPLKIRFTILAIAITFRHLQCNNYRIFWMRSNAWKLFSGATHHRPTQECQPLGRTVASGSWTSGY